MTKKAAKKNTKKISEIKKAAIQKEPSKKRKDLVVTNALDLKQMLDIIADNYEMTTTAYVKQKLRAAISAEPERMKIKRPQF